MAEPNAILSAARASVTALPERRQNLAEAKFQWQRENRDEDQTLKEHADALQTANRYYNLASNLSKMEDETKTRLDAADFLAKLPKISVKQPDYEDQITALAAQHPRAPSDPGVKEILGTKATARANYVDSLKAGGMSEFAPGPAQDAYQRELASSNGTVYSAKAAAAAVQKGETEVTKAFQSGHLKADDLEWGKNADGSPVAKTSNPHFIQEGPHAGTINYESLLRTAAERAGKAKQGQEITERVKSAAELETATATSAKAALELKNAQEINPKDLDRAMKIVKGVDPTIAPGKEGGPPATMLPDGKTPNPAANLYWDSLKTLGAHANRVAPGDPAAVTPVAAAPVVAPADQEAIAWVNANPSDPRAAAIKAKLGIK